MFLNQVIIVGNLTRDPELKALPSGSKVANLSMATNRTWKDQNGEKKEAVEYHYVVVFGRQAETCAQYLQKGQQVLVRGRLQTRSWEADDGSKRYKTEIVSENVQFGKRPEGSQSNVSGHNDTSVDDYHKNLTGGENTDEISYPDEDINPEDISF